MMSNKLDESDIEILRAIKTLECEGIDEISSYMLSKRLYGNQPDNKDKYNFGEVRDRCRFIDYRMRKMLKMNILLSHEKQGPRRPGTYFKINECENIEYNGNNYPKIMFIDGDVDISIDKKDCISLNVGKSLLIIEDENRMQLHNLNQPFCHVV